MQQGMVVSDRPMLLDRLEPQPSDSLIALIALANDDPRAEKGWKLIGDVAFEEVREVASAITPVPGGVGLMTRALLMSNTLDAARRRAA